MYFPQSIVLDFSAVFKLPKRMHRSALLLLSVLLWSCYLIRFIFSNGTFIYTHNRLGGVEGALCFLKKLQMPGAILNLVGIEL